MNLGIGLLVFSSMMTIGIKKLAETVLNLSMEEFAFLMNMEMKQSFKNVCQLMVAGLNGCQSVTVTVQKQFRVFG